MLNSTTPASSITIRAALIGAQGAGKTSLLQQYLDPEHKFDANYYPTTTIETQHKLIPAQAGQPPITFELLDVPQMSVEASSKAFAERPVDIFYLCINTQLTKAERVKLHNILLFIQEDRQEHARQTFIKDCYEKNINHITEFLDVLPEIQKKRRPLYFIIFTQWDSGSPESEPEQRLINRLKDAVCKNKVNIKGVFYCSAKNTFDTNTPFEEGLNIRSSTPKIPIEEKLITGTPAPTQPLPVNPVVNALVIGGAAGAGKTTLIQRFQIGTKTTASDSTIHLQAKSARILTFLKSRTLWTGLFTAGLLFGAILPFLPIAISFSVAFLLSLGSSFLLGLMSAQALPKHSVLFRPIERLFLEDSAHKNHLLIVFWTAAFFIAALCLCILYMYTAPVTLTMTITTLVTAMLTGTAFISTLRFFWDHKDTLAHEDFNTEFDAHAEQSIPTPDSDENENNHQHGCTHRSQSLLGQNDATTFGSAIAVGSHTHTITMQTQPILSSMDTLSSNTPAKRS